MAILLGDVWFVSNLTHVFGQQDKQTATSEHTLEKEESESISRNQSICFEGRLPSSSSTTRLNDHIKGIDNMSR